MRPVHRKLLALCFFCSGASGLALEVAWSKQLSYILGNSLYAISTAVAAFMAGLCAGSAIASRRGAGLARPVRAYGIIELAIGACAAVSITVFRETEPLFRALYQSLEPGHGTFLLVRFLLTFCIVAAPATLMGMTLPLVIGAASRDRVTYSLEAGTLYGVNTLGAVLGTLGAGFFLIPAIGLFKSCLLVGLVDGAIGIAAIALDRTVNAAAPGPAHALAPANAPTPRPRWTSAQRSIAILFGVSGALAMFYEVAWFRLLALTLGPSVFAFSAMLGMFLAGIGSGSAIAAPYVSRVLKVRAPAGGGAGGALMMALLEAVLGAVGILTLYYLNRLPTLHVSLFQSLAGSLGASGFSVALVVTAGLLVLPATFLMGALFPAAVRALQEAGGPIAAETNVGRLYMFNAAGSIAGSLLAGFWVVPVLGVWNTLLTAAIGSSAIGLAVVFFGAPGATAAPATASTATAAPGANAASSGKTGQSRKPPKGSPAPERAAGRPWIPIAALSVITCVLAFAAPPWDLALFNQGLYRAAYEGRAAPVADASGTRGLVSYQEGINAPVAVYNSAGDGFLKVSGKSDASTVPFDMLTQVFVGQFPILFAPHARTVGLVGYGSGVSVKAALSHKSVERLDVIELEQAILDASPWFECINGRPLDDPRVHLIVEDGRVHLTYTDRVYDVIISEPSNPWIAGIANLFTTDFYQRVRGRLAPDGVFGQWIQAYQISEPALAGILKTVHSVFPHCIVMQLSPFDLMILASTQPISVPWEEFDRRVREPEVAASLARVGVQQPYDVTFFLRLPEAQFEALAATAPEMNTDDNVWLEHRMPHELVHDIRDQSGDVVARVTALGAAHRISALEAMLPGLPVTDCAARIAAFPHLGEPINVPNRTSADPWVRSRTLLRDGMRDELAASGRSVLADYVMATDAKGEAYRMNRLAVTGFLMDLVAKSPRVDPVEADKALRQAPDHPFAQVTMADAYLALRRPDEAEALYTQVLADPSNTTTLQALLGMANVSFARRDLPAARVWAQKAVDRSPFVPAAWLTAARLADLSGETAGGSEFLRRGQRFNPDDASIAEAIAKR